MIQLLLAPWAVDEFMRLHTDGVEIRIGRGMQTGAQIEGGVGIIPVHGPIDYRVSMLTEAGLAASSEAIRADFQQMLSDSSVDRIVFDINSPGGLYSGMPELAADVFASRGTKPTVAVANPMAASGALWLGAAAERFVSLGSGSVGSVGALMVHQDASEMFASAGIRNTILRSPEGKADFNPLEPLGDESRQHHQEVVDRIADEFVGQLAKFRGVTKREASERFGQGRMLDAPAALSAGLIDAVVPSLSAAISRAPRSRSRLPARLEIARILAERQRAS